MATKYKRKLSKRNTRKGGGVIRRFKKLLGYQPKNNIRNTVYSNSDFEYGRTTTPRTNANNALKLTVAQEKTLSNERELKHKNNVAVQKALLKEKVSKNTSFINSNETLSNVAEKNQLKEFPKENYKYQNHDEEQYADEYINYYYYIHDNMKDHKFKKYIGQEAIEKQLVSNPGLYSQRQDIRKLLLDDLDFAYHIAKQNRQGFMKIDSIFFGQLLEKGDLERPSNLVSSNFGNLLGK